ncbi:MAG: hypothetical protein ACK4UJ_01735 [Leptonema sp. (in: bacteria)]
MALSKNNQGIQKLLITMKKLIREVNDKEICNKLEILVSSEKEDIPPNLIKDLLDSPLTFDPTRIPEPYVQYVRHFIYMVKREKRLTEKKQAIQNQKKEKQNQKKQRKKQKTKKNQEAIE